MSILGNLFNELTGSDSGSAESTSAAERPCKNCPSDCSLTDAQCAVCKPYKEKLVDAIYNVEHKDEILAKYEVDPNAGTETAGTSAKTAGKVICPYCGGPSENPYKCDYCGMKLGDASGSTGSSTAKIKVKSASDLPNPVLEAQDLIFNRYNALKTAAKKDVNGDGKEDTILDTLFAALNGEGLVSGDTFGNKMTESEITEMAGKYGVSVSDYLTGLDNGKYYTKSAYEKRKKQEQSGGTMQGQRPGWGTSGQMQGGFGNGGKTGALTGLAGAAGLAGAVLGGSALNSAKNNGKNQVPPPPMNGNSGQWQQGGPGAGPDRNDERNGSWNNNRNSGRSNNRNDGWNNSSRGDMRNSGMGFSRGQNGGMPGPGMPGQGMGGRSGMPGGQDNRGGMPGGGPGGMPGGGRGPGGRR